MPVTIAERYVGRPPKFSLRFGVKACIQLPRLTPSFPPAINNRLHRVGGITRVILGYTFTPNDTSKTT